MLSHNLKTGALALSVSLLALTAGCQVAPSTGEESAEETQVAVDANAPRLGTFGFDAEGMDLTTEAGDDFFRYANGTWLDTTEIPSDRASYGMFTVLALEAEDDVKAIIEEAAATDAENGTNAQLVGDLYASWMDAETIDASGIAPAQPYLDAIASAASWEDVATLFATEHYPAPWRISIVPGPADTTKYTLFIGQSGLGLPDGDYYFNEDETFASHREAYVAYIEAVLTEIGYEDPAGNAAAIFELETALAEDH
jgi:endothelin-converting enzyme/putative endopeptidase